MPPSLRCRWEFWSVAVLACVVAVAYLAAGRFDLATESGVTAHVHEEFSQTLARPVRDVLVTGDWVSGAGGLELKPGRTGDMVAQVRNTRHDSLILLVRGSGGSRFHLGVAVSGDGQFFREVARGRLDDGGGLRVDLTSDVSKWDTAWIKLSASMDETVGDAGPAVLSVFRVITKWKFSFPNVPVVGVLVLAPLLAYVAWSVQRPQQAFVGGLGVLLAFAAFAQATWPSAAPPVERWWEILFPFLELIIVEGDDWFLVAYAALFVVLAWRARIWNGPDHERRRWEWFALAGILAWGGSLRLEWFVKIAGAPLDPDVQNFRLLAQTMASPYDTGSREPLWIWMVKGALLLPCDFTLSIRLLGIVMSLSVVYAAYKLFRDYTGKPAVGLLVAALLSLNPFLVKLSPHGLRDEAYAVTILCFVYFVFVPNPKLSLRGTMIGLALSGAAVQLLRFQSYVFLAMLLLVWAWRQGAGKWKAVALPIVFIAAVSVPLLVHNAREFGDPLKSINVHAVWARNYEFVIAKKVGCDGCPSQEDFYRNSYAGQPVSALGYLFGMHSVEEVVSMTSRGYAMMYLTPTDLFEIQSGTQSRLGFAFYLIGLGLVLFCRYREMLAVIVLVINVIPFSMALGIDPRISIQTVPYVTFILAYGLWWSFEQAVRLGTTVGVSVSLLRFPKALSR